MGSKGFSGGKEVDKYIKKRYLTNEQSIKNAYMHTHKFINSSYIKINNT